jgi:hypothetical protein
MVLKSAPFEKKAVDCFVISKKAAVCNTIMAHHFLQPHCLQDSVVRQQ